MKARRDDGTEAGGHVTTDDDGKPVFVFEGPPGDEQDREILSMSDNIFVARFVSPEINARYGTLIYVRCNKARA